MRGDPTDEGKRKDAERDGAVAQCERGEHLQVEEGDRGGREGAFEETAEQAEVKKLRERLKDTELERDNRGDLLPPDVRNENRGQKNCLFEHIELFYNGRRLSIPRSVR